MVFIGNISSSEVKNNVQTLNKDYFGRLASNITYDTFKNY